ncbi:MFS transporter [Terrabacter sp. NPDC080008]|uniref:MFS transporter n=1 Tax=Terrabacter sp. NPDC080008 TaxID=3155176 RepID=UPI00344FAB9E
MSPSQGNDVDAPTFAAVLRVRRYLPVFLANALSMWGDYIARITIAAVVYNRTGSPLATAGTLAVSLVPTFLGRSLLGPLVDRMPYKWVLIWSHLLRATCVLVLMGMVLQNASYWLLFLVLFVLELIGGASTASYMVLLTDLVEDRRLYAKAVALGAMSEQFNQAIGLAVGGGLIAIVGPETGLVFDLVTFVVSAVVILFVVQVRPVHGERGRGVRGFARDLSSAASDLARHPVLFRLMSLSAVACVGIVAPEALALPIADGNRWGGVLMASPIVGAVVGIVLIGRMDVLRQNRTIVPLALAMPVPLLLAALQPPLWVTMVLFFLSGVLQAFMVPLQATFALTTEPAMRGRIFSLAGSVSVAAAGVSYLAAGWVAKYATPNGAVAICAAVCLVLTAVLAVTWPHRRVRLAVDSAYATTSSRAA